jgi:hypothetical protein
MRHNGNGIAIDPTASRLQWLQTASLKPVKPGNQAKASRLHLASLKLPKLGLRGGRQLQWLHTPKGVKPEASPEACPKTYLGSLTHPNEASAHLKPAEARGVLILPKGTSLQNIAEMLDLGSCGRPIKGKQP